MIPRFDSFTLVTALQSIACKKNIENRQFRAIRYLRGAHYRIDGRAGISLPRHRSEVEV
jgi:hypothetical protein